ncbi:MAG: nucleotidyltransferase family protein [Acidobacteriota bacterium]|nr:nucleotidyltransferase family protein [Acidobacteriota bacterium]
MSTEQALVLARGLGTRMRAADGGAHLTPDQQRAADAGSKVMMPIAGRPFLDYVLNSIADAGIRRVGLVVAPAHDALAHHYAEVSPPSRLEIEFVVQAEPRGTADAMLAAEAWTQHEAFLVMNGDNLYPADVLRDLAALHEPGLPGFRRGDLITSSNIPDGRVASFALIKKDDSGYLTGIIEKPAADVFARAGADALVSMNCWRFDGRIFQSCRAVPLSPRGELELPEAVALAVQRGVAFRVVPAAGPVLDLSYRADAAVLASRLENVAIRL